jgi:hypothetical protein
MEPDFLDSAGIGIFDHTEPLELELVALDNDLIVIEYSFKILHLSPLHAPDGPDTHVHICHCGFEIIKFDIFFLALLDLFHEEPEILSKTIHYDVSVHSHLQMGLESSGRLQECSYSYR